MPMLPKIVPSVVSAGAAVGIATATGASAAVGTKP